MDDMYAGEPSYDDDVEHDQAAYQQQFLDFREFLVKWKRDTFDKWKTNASYFDENIKVFIK